MPTPSSRPPHASSRRPRIRRFWALIIAIVSVGLAAQLGVSSYSSGPAAPDASTSGTATADAGVVALDAAIEGACPPGGVPAGSMTDIAGSTHEAAIECGVWHGLFQGFADGTFGPSRSITRAQFTTVVSRLAERAGVPLPQGASGAFADVADDAAHAGAIHGLAEAGVIEGLTDGTFAPDQPIARDQAATLVVEVYAWLTGEALPTGSDAFDDDDGNVHEDAIGAAAAAGWLVGVDTGHFAPARDISRAQMASVLARVASQLVADDLLELPDEQELPEGTEPVHVEVAAIGETEAVAGSGDDADDPAIWHHPSDPGASLILGTNKHDDDGGLHVYDPQGNELQFLEAGMLNNVDVRTSLDGLGDYAAASNRSEGEITVFAIDGGEVRTAGAVDVPGEPYGFCLGVHDGTHYAVVTYHSGEAGQYALSAADGAVSGTHVRTIDVGGQLEGCVADDDHGVLYIGEEDRGIYAYGLDPATGDDRTAVDYTGSDGNLSADVEGLAIYEAGSGDGFLLASSQGDSRIDVYRRGGDHAYVGSVRIVAAGDTDGVSDTDGVEVTDAAIGEFDQGLLIVHDNDNEGADASNYKFVSWEDVAAAMATAD